MIDPCVTYGNDKFVIVGITGTWGTDSTVLYSEDGITWTEAGTWDGVLMRSVTYDNDKFVVVGNAGIVLYSEDGIVWTETSSGVSKQLASVTYGNNKFVAAGASGTVLYSEDGITWNSSSSGTTLMLYSVTYGKDKFVAVGTGGTVLYSENYTTTVKDAISTNASNIEAVAADAKSNAEDIEELRSDVSANASDIEELTTMDVLTNNLGEWKTPTTIPEVWSVSESRLNAIAYGDGRFVGVGNSGLISYSDDGDTWYSVSNSEITANLLGIAYGNGKFVVVSESLYAYYSDNGETWSKVLLGYDSFCKIVYGNGIFIAMSGSLDDHVMKYSEDGVTWTTYNAGTDGDYDYFVDITYGNGMFVACTGADENNIYYSEDGIAWNISTCDENLELITYGNGKFIGISYSNNVAYYSINGITWICSENSLSIYNNSALVYGNGKFVIVNKDGYWSYSEDGLTWETPEKIGSVSLYGLIYANGKFVTVGSSSSDGNNIYYTEYQIETKTIKESVVELQKTVNATTQLKIATISGTTNTSGNLETTDLLSGDIMIVGACRVSTASAVTPYINSSNCWCFRVEAVSTSVALVKSTAVEIQYVYYEL